MLRRKFLRSGVQFERRTGLFDAISIFMPVTDSPPAQEPSAPSTVTSSSPEGTVPLWRCGVLLGLTLLMVLSEAIHPSAGATPQSGVVMALPDEVTVPLPDRPNAQFYGTSASITEGELGTLPADTELVRKEYDDYRDHEAVQFTILLSGAAQNSIHRAEVCLPGQGWTVVGQDNLTVPLASGHNLIVRNLAIQRDNLSSSSEHHILHAYFMYWFVGENLTTPSQFMRVFLNSWDRIFYNRAHRWAYVMIESAVSDSLRPDGLNAAQTQKMMSDFIRQTVPAFQKSEMSAQAAH